VYSQVAKAGVYKASDIRTAEAAKVIENIQRDLNIALMNELSMLFHRLGLNTREVLKAARTKWNFLPFEPGLVGGHCIPVDPYYLTHKAQEVGYHPEVILAGRRINDSMGLYVAHETIKLLIRAGKAVEKANILVLGVTFKEDVPDVRNTRVLDLVQEIEGYGSKVFVHDPLIDNETLERLGLNAVKDPFRAGNHYDAVILAVPHQVFRKKGLKMYLNLLEGGDKPGVFVDVKGILPEMARTSPEVLYWRL
ncbi:MAG: nucleotide sugar dehydrogenase, partial [Nitrospirae bacterium]|nr:nucleotide sugar dehydrogenase [Nitrospirota bacterium]